MLLILYTLALVILLLGASIFVHELGHFLVARRCGMVVDVFSIGFGHAIWKRKVGDITYKIGWIPFGGYVALPQMDPTHSAAGEVETQERQLPPVAPWKRIVVAVAGATGNILFAIPLAWLVFAAGRPAACYEYNTVIGYVVSNSPSARAGVAIGDAIVSVNGHAVANWNEIAEQCADANTVQLQLRSPAGVAKSAVLTLTNGLLNLKQFDDLMPQQFCTVAKPMRGYPAAEIGLRRGDRVIECNGQPIYSRPQLTDIVSARPGLPTPLKILREGQTLALTITPKYDPQEKRALIGILYTDYRFDVDFTQRTHPKPGALLREYAGTIFRVLHALVTPGQSGKTAQLLGGPLEIIIEYWLMIQSSLMLAISFTCFLNINLAVINLLPIPLFDGGHVLFALWEAVTRRPLNRRVLNALMNFFVVLILLLAVFLTYRDARRNFFPRSLTDEPATNGAASATTHAPAPGATTNAPAPK